VRLLPLRLDGVPDDPHHAAPLFTTEDGALGVRAAGVTLTDDPAAADLAALVPRWGAVGAARPTARAALDRATAAGLPTVVWVDGDLEADLDRPGLVLYEQGAEGVRRWRQAAVRGWPVLIHDHLVDLFAGEVAPVAHGDRPTVGFCGQAAAPRLGEARLLAGKLRHRVRRALGGDDRRPAPLASHLRLRRRVLAALEHDPRVATDFVVRDRYRAGLRDHAERADRTHPTANEFFANIRANAYTVCVRGGGNFSTRLYETLCLGRIPVLVDTDLVLPWADEVDWAAVTVRVPADGLGGLADRVVAHHAAHDEEAFGAAQAACRRLWEEWLSVPGFFSRLGPALPRRGAAPPPGPP